MLVPTPAHHRTVHPHLARAALLGVRRYGGGPAADEVDRLLDADAPVPEALHHALLTELLPYGWPAFTGAAAHLLDRPREADIVAVVERGAITELVDQIPALQLRFHVGHTTAVRLHRGRITVTHRALLGAVPGAAESHFVAAIHRTLVGACVGTTPAVTLHHTDGRRLPAGADRTAGPLTGWHLDLTDPPGLPPSWAAAVRETVAEDPARRWRLDAVAARWALSTRTLQRLLGDDGTGFRELVTGTRLAIARGLVLRTDLGLSEIAATCGFTDHAHLTRSFAAHFGRPPSALRRPVAPHRPRRR
ncbi:helix-turn-helix transcriptional regulator [Micromonospora echinofusca]|uniref:Helix-turn-helix domain-containing protein n=1 Tax=Micromonospora echinofusca TaxID=47858 RepID=A0ABS3VK34_MICEH|nr:helix-turn-helix transcriptional regulator [Micromonospora echinofusca]MBO4204890.1 helix-turn-helix domain-containing protein [Micromonospora echinofusca]